MFAIWLTAQRGKEDDRETEKKKEQEGQRERYEEQGEKVVRWSRPHSYKSMLAIVWPTIITVDLFWLSFLFCIVKPVRHHMRILTHTYLSSPYHELSCLPVLLHR